MKELPEHRIEQIALAAAQDFYTRNPKYRSMPFLVSDIKEAIKDSIREIRKSKEGK